MRNKDVIRHIHVLLFPLCMAVSYPLHAKDADLAFIDNRVSYEDYMPGSHDGRQAGTRACIKKTSRKGYKPAGGDKKHIVRKYLSYRVRRGDNLTAIAKKFNVPADAIRSINNIKKNTIKTGTTIKIPSPATSDPGRNGDRKIVESKTGNNKKPHFRWPLPVIIDYKQDEFNGVKPIGIIIFGKPGSPVLSSAPGVVKKIGHMRGFGKYIVINHPDRYSTVYANLTEITVIEGEKIYAGNIIGKINRSDTKLHFQIDFEGKPENPLKYLPKNS